MDSYSKRHNLNPNLGMVGNRQGNLSAPLPGSGLDLRSASQRMNLPDPIAEERKKKREEEARADALKRLTSVVPNNNRAEQFTGGIKPIDSTTPVTTNKLTAGVGASLHPTMALGNDKLTSLMKDNASVQTAPKMSGKSPEPEYEKWYAEKSKVYDSMSDTDRKNLDMAYKLSKIKKKGEKNRFAEALDEAGYNSSDMIAYMERKDAREYNAMVENEAKQQKGIPRFLMGVGATGTTALQPIDAFNQLMALGDDRPYDPNTAKYTKYKEIVRGEKAEELAQIENPLLRKLASGGYNLLTSVSDSLIGMAGAELGGTALVADAIMGASAMSDAYNRATEKGQSKEQATALGIINGAAEAIGEHFSLEKVWKVSKNAAKAEAKTFLTNIAKQGLIEGSEEMTTNVIDEIADRLISGDKSEYATNKRRYQSRLIQNGMSEKEAEFAASNMANLDFIKQTLVEAGYGFLSGSIFGAGASFEAGIQYKKLGTNTDAEASQKLYEASKNAPSYSTARQIADSVESAEALTPKQKAKMIQSLQGTEEYLNAQNKNETDTNLDEDNGNQNAYSNPGSTESSPEKNNSLQNQENEKENAPVSIEEAINSVRESNVRAEQTKTLTKKNLIVNQNVDSKNGTKIADITGISMDEKGISFKKGDAWVKANKTVFNTQDTARVVQNAVANTTSNEQALNYIKNFEEGKISPADYNALYNSIASAARSQMTLDQYQASSPILSKKIGFDKLAAIYQFNKDAGLKMMERNVAKPQTELVRTFAKNLGINVQIGGFEGNNEVNGRYDPATDTIYLSDTAENPLSVVFSHEFVHYLSQNDKEAFSSLKTFAVDVLKESDPVMYKTLFANRAGQYSDEIRELEAKGWSKQQIADYIDEELVANSTEAVMENIAKMSDAQLKKTADTLVKEHRSLVERIVDRLKEFLSKIKTTLSGYNAQTEEAQLLSTEVDRLEAFQKALMESMAKTAKANEGKEASFVDTRREENTIKEMDIAVDSESGTAVRNSVRTTLAEVWKEKGYKSYEDALVKVAKSIAKNAGVTNEKALDWLRAEESIANIILGSDENIKYLDYVADKNYTGLKKNGDYAQGTIDLSNLCRKREIFTKMFDNLQRENPEMLFTADDIAAIRQILVESNYETACALCYVEDRRQRVGEIADAFIGFYKMALESPTKRVYKMNSKNEWKPLKVSADNMKKYDHEAEIYASDPYVPNQYDLVTYQGFADLRKNHPEVALAFETYNNSRGQGAARLIEGHAEYERDILKWTKSQINKANNLGGMRIFSFSDFEAIHLIDVVQALIDCSAKGVKVQAYTKVPSFARLVSKTGVKLNRSLIPATSKTKKAYAFVDGKYVAVEANDNGIAKVNGKDYLAFDIVEGIDVTHEDFMDEADNPNIGNILIGMSDDQVKIAFTDPNIDYIIPFHTGQSKKVLETKGIGHWKNYKDLQEEKKLDGFIKNVDKERINIYTDVINKYNVTNKYEFVNAYIKECKDNHLQPKFEEYLVHNADGDYFYREGYHKLLIDYKLFDREGKILPQETITPDFDLELINKILEADKERSKNLKFSDEVMDKVRERLAENGKELAARNSKKVRISDLSSQEKALGHKAIRESINTVHRFEKDLGDLPFEMHAYTFDNIFYYRYKGEFEYDILSVYENDKTLNEIATTLRKDIAKNARNIGSREKSDLLANLIRQVGRLYKSDSDTTGNRRTEDRINEVDAGQSDSNEYADRIESLRDSRNLNIENIARESRRKSDYSAINSDISYSNASEILREGFKLLGDNTIPSEDVQKIAEKLLRSQKSGYEASNFTENLNALFAYIGKHKNAKMDDLIKIAYQVAYPVIQETEGFKRGDENNTPKAFNLALRIYQEYFTALGKKDVADKIEKATNKVKDRYELRLKNQKLRREETDLRKSIATKKANLDRMLTNPTKGSHIPLPMVRSVVDLASAINTDKERMTFKAKDEADKVKRAYDRLKNDPIYGYAYDEQIAKYISIASDIFAEKTVGELDKQELETINTILAAVLTQVSNENQFISKNRSESLYEAREKAIGEVKVSKGFNDSNALSRFNNSYQSIALNFERLMNRVFGYKDNSEGKWMTDLLKAGEEKSLNVIREVDNLFSDVVGGENQSQRNANRLAILDLTGKGKNGKIDTNTWVELPSYRGGEKAMVPKALRLSLIMHLLSTDNLRHIAYGGFRIPNIEEYQRGNISEAYSRGTLYHIPFFDNEDVKDAKAAVDSFESWEDDTFKRNTNNPLWKKYKALKDAFDRNKGNEQLRKDMNDAWDEYQKERKNAYRHLDQVISQRGNEYLSLIESDLSDYERSFLEDAKTFFWDLSGDKINETSLNLYGYKKANVENYFPLNVDKNFIQTDNAAVKFDGTLEGAGYLKDRVSSKKPILLEDITNVVDRHTKQIAQFNGYAEAVRDVKALLNNGKDNVSLRDTIALKWGDKKGAMSMIDRTIADIETSRSDNSFFNQYINKIRSNFAGAVLTGNVQVMIKQAASYPTAAAEVGWKPLAKALKNVSSEGIKEIEDRSPLMHYREQGYSTQELGDIKSMKAYGDSLKWFTGMISWMDVRTVRTLEYAAKYYIDENTNLEEGTGEYWEAVTEKFNDIVRNTQPNYTVLERPELLKDQNALFRTLFMFKTQPVQNYGILYDAFAKANATKKAYGKNSAEAKEANRRLANAISSNIVAAAVFSMMTIAGKVVYHNLGDLDDEKEDKINWDEVIKTFFQGIVSSEFGMVLGGQELYDFINSKITGDRYYGMSDSIVESFNDVTEGINNLQSSLEKISDAKTDEDKEKAKIKSAYYARILASNIAKLFGVPADNIYKPINSIIAYAEDIASGDLWSSKGILSKDTSGVVKQTDRMYEALNSGNEEEYARLFDQAVASSEASDPEKSVETKVKATLKEKYLDGSITDSDAAKILVSEFGKTEDEAYWQIDEWKHTKDGSSEGYKKYEKLFDSLESNNTTADILNEYLNHGVDADTLVTQITIWYHDYLKEHGNNSSVQANVLNAYQKLGKKREDKLKDINNWIKKNL